MEFKHTEKEIKNMVDCIFCFKNIRRISKETLKQVYFFQLWVCVYAYMSVCAALACRYLWKPAEGIGFPGAGVTCGCEMCDVCTEN